MKIRAGFVSNSSSSSFVFVGSKEELRETLKDMHPYIQHMVNSNIRYGKDKVFGGQNVVVIQGTDTTDEFPYEIEDYVGEVLGESGAIGSVSGEGNAYQELEYETPLYAGDCFEKLAEKMNEDGKDAIYNSWYG